MVFVNCNNVLNFNLWFAENFKNNYTGNKHSANAVFKIKYVTSWNSIKYYVTILLLSFISTSINLFFNWIPNLHIGQHMFYNWYKFLKHGRQNDTSCLIHSSALPTLTIDPGPSFTLLQYKLYVLSFKLLNCVIG